MVRQAIAAALVVAGCGGEAHPPTVSRAWPTMGTMMSAAAWGADSARLDRAMDAARDTVERIDSLLSIFRTHSEISRINRGAARQPVEVTPTFAAVLGKALAVARASGGAFDPTKRNWRGVRFDSAGRTVALRRGLELDFGGIAKGYALDRAALVFAGIADSVLLDLGGQFLWVGGPTPDSTRRSVGIADPDNALSALAAVELFDGSVSTSSQAEEPGHIVDPRGSEGRTPPPAKRARSVTVLARDGMTADAWSTAFFVLGCDSALALAPHLDEPVSVVCADSAGVRWTTDLDGRVLLPIAPGGPLRSPGEARAGRGP